MPHHDADSTGLQILTLEAPGRHTAAAQGSLSKILDTCLVNRSLKAFMQICTHLVAWQIEGSNVLDDQLAVT